MLICLDAYVATVVAEEAVNWGMGGHWKGRSEERREMM